MRLATIRLHDGSTRAVRVEGEMGVELGAKDLGELLAAREWRRSAESSSGAEHRLADVELAPVVPKPSKVVCVGLNYRTHILEMGRQLPEYPTLFAKFADTLIGAHDDILRPAETEELDWECELAIVVGAKVRRARGADAEAAIAGFSVLNDITCRDWQYRTVEWLQGKNWQSSTPVGPYLVTPDELAGGVRPALAITTVVDGETMQQDDTGDLLFDPPALVEYISTMVTLRPGDIIATGTPGGVGHARKPARYLKAGQRVVTDIAGLGTLDNLVVADSGSA
ncbi:MAG: fumarylacetoacetate hydrolase family protein [Dermatophilaceae bacterium]